METMIIERERVLGGRKGEDSRQGSRAMGVAFASQVEPPTAGTAVFVGKASFRMVALGQDVVVDPTTPVARSQSAAVSATQREWFEVGDEKVILTPPGTAIETRSPSEPPSEIDGVRGQSGHGDQAGEPMRASRKGLPAWAVAAALVAGATITLSAQAVMRRPVEENLAPVTTVSPSAPATAAGSAMPEGATPAPPAPELSVPPPTTLRASPTVVPTTVVWAVNGDRQTFGHSAHALPADRNRSSRPPRAQSRPLPEKGSVARTRTVAWVDPFVTGDAGATAAHGPARRSADRAWTSAAYKASARATPVRRGDGSTTPAGRWVDPFMQ